MYLAQSNSAIMIGCSYYLRSNLFASIILWRHFSILKRRSVKTPFLLIGHPQAGRAVDAPLLMGDTCRQDFPVSQTVKYRLLHPSNQIQSLFAEDDVDKLVENKNDFSHISLLWRNSSLWRRGKLAVDERETSAGCLEGNNKSGTKAKVRHFFTGKVTRERQILWSACGQWKAALENLQSEWHRKLQYGGSGITWNFWPEEPHTPWSSPVLNRSGCQATTSTLWTWWY